MSLADLPRDVLSEIAVRVAAPRDYVALASTCRELRTVMRPSSHLVEPVSPYHADAYDRHAWMTYELPGAQTLNVFPHQRFGIVLVTDGGCYLHDANVDYDARGNVRSASRHAADVERTVMFRPDLYMFYR